MEKSRNWVSAKAQSGALSVGSAIWQSRRMACALAGALLFASAAQAGPDGPIFTVKRGDYACELPGTALTRAGLRQPGEDFTIRQGSIYTTATGRGSYLASGDEIRMTSGPKLGERFLRESENFLRKLTKDGQPSDLRCIRRVLNNL